MATLALGIVSDEIDPDFATAARHAAEWGITRFELRCLVSGRVPAVEVLISTAYIRDCIEQKEKTKLIRDAMAGDTSQYGMQTFDQSLYSLYKSGLITLEEALRRASNPDEFKLRIQGIQSTADISREEMESTLESGTEQDIFSPTSPFEFGGKENQGS